MIYLVERWCGSTMEKEFVNASSEEELFAYINKHRWRLVRAPLLYLEGKGSPNLIDLVREAEIKAYECTASYSVKQKIVSYGTIFGTVEAVSEREARILFEAALKARNGIYDSFDWDERNTEILDSDEEEIDFESIEIEETDDI